MPPFSHAMDLCTLAVKYDSEGFYEQAIYYYKEAVRLLTEICNQNPDHSDITTWINKKNEYEKRFQSLEYKVDNGRKKRTVDSVSESISIRLKQCHFLFKQALDADESNLKNTALQLYTKAVELALPLKKDISDDDVINKLKSIACQALERAEKLKHEGNHASYSSNVKQAPIGIAQTQSQNNFDNSNQLKVSGRDTYTEDEKRVLLVTSRINKHEYLPFMSIDLEEKFQYSIPFTDRDGFLELSPSQKKHFLRWARPHEFSRNPKMVADNHANYLTIKQTIVADCSFVSALAVAAQYERKFSRRIITSIIYPQKRNSVPIYNPFGKYMVKFHLNGILRKVVIDDQLPLGRNNELLCSYSTNTDELWVSLLEKAYMKVMGGYDFPGSNSSIDLHALTGWIPERKTILCDDSTFNSESLFNVLLTRLHTGDALVTVATGALSEADEKRTGLVSTHGYAVLDVRKLKDCRLLQLKNPWSHIRWKGNYSELDLVHWTRELKEALNYDPHSAQAFDNGIFWIDYESVLKFFDVFYMNWNPDLFTHTFCIHQSWKAGMGPAKDLYNIGENPQFCLDVKNAKSGAVWILLTRHITEVEDFKNNREYITVVVYKNNGKRIYYPNEPEPFITGVRINSPHYLCKIILGENSPQYFTLVVSQYEKMNTINYTLRAYSTFPFSLQKFPDYYKYVEKSNDGQWTEHTAGGCRNHPNTYGLNPTYQIDLNSNNDNNYLLVELKGPKQYQIGIEVTLVKLNDESVTGKFKRVTSGDYRNGFVIMEINEAQPGLYNIVPSTYLPKQEGPFILTIKSSSPINMTRLR